MKYSGKVKDFRKFLHAKVMGMLNSSQYRDNPEVYGLVSELDHIDEIEAKEYKEHKNKYPDSFISAKEQSISEREFLDLHQGDNMSDSNV